MTDKEILEILNNVYDFLPDQIRFSRQSDELYELIEEFTKRAQQEQQDDNHLLVNDWEKS